MDEERNEIIIVRRGNNDEADGHHGGTWKIAYADFMTAMMAFFLVMWLVNATSEETKKVIASYFNPIKLIDEQPKPRGIDEDDVKTDVKEEALEGKKSYLSNNSEQPSLAQSAHLLDSPYGALETIVLLERGMNVKQNEGNAPEFKPDVLPRLYDPFSPQYWDEASALEEEEEFKSVVLSEKEESVKEEDRKENEQSATHVDLVKEQQALVAALRVDFENLIIKTMAQHSAQGRPSLQVMAQDEGVLIELSDNSNYGMFDIGSSKPHSEIVSLLEGMAKIIAPHPGEVIISGHTDQRPYKTEHYDNWQLSSARAQMAYYMLKRGGLDEKRVLRVEGYADRSLKNEADPYADENRRIAIFLKMPATPLSTPLHVTDAPQSTKGEA